MIRSALPHLSKATLRLAAFGVMSLLGTGVLAASDAQASGYVPDQLVVRFKSDVSAQQRADIRREQDATVDHALPIKGVQLLDIADGTSVASARSSFERDPGVAYAEPNYIVKAEATPNDTSYGMLWGLNNTGQTVNGNPGVADADIDAPEAWNATTGSSAVTVAVVDTGVAYDHPDLSPNIWTNPGETGSGKETNGIDDDGNSLIDDWRGWDYVDNDNDPRDFFGHGTHVAGTIGAKGNNAQGVAGVNWNVGLMPLRGLGADGAGTTSALASAFAYAGDKGADVANASLGGSGFSQAVLDAINGAPNTLFVVAAGNNNNDNDVATTQYPCNYTPANLICVAASTQSDGLASFSNYGTTSVDLAAPGTSILSTVPAYNSMFSDNFEGPLGASWTTGGTNNSWANTTEFATSGSSSLSDSPAANYLSSTDSWVQTTSPVNLTGQEGCQVAYNAKLGTEANVDKLFVEGSTDNSIWTPTANHSGSSSGGYFAFSDTFHPFDGNATAYVRFRLNSDAANNFDGVHIDDVTLRCLTGTYAGTEYLYEQGTSMATPHVAGAAALYLAQNPSATVADVRAALLDSVDLKPAFSGKTVTGGRLNIGRALGQVVGFLTKWGTKGTADGQFKNPRGIATDSTGNVYVADTSNNRIQKFTSAGTFITKWGTKGSADGQLKSPYDVAVDGSNNVYVADTSNGRIQKFSSTGTFLAKFGTKGTADGQLKNPHGVATDGAGNVYVADTSNSRIQKFSSAGAFIAKWGTKGSADGQLKNPYDLKVDSSNNVFVADTGNNRIQKFSSTGTFLAKWGTKGGLSNQFKNPHGVAIDPAGNVYVVDTGNGRASQWSATGSLLSSFGSKGVLNGQFKNPWDVAIDSTGNLFVTDMSNGRVQKLK